MSSRPEAAAEIEPPAFEVELSVSWYQSSPGSADSFQLSIRERMSSTLLEDMQSKYYPQRPQVSPLPEVIPVSGLRLEAGVGPEGYWAPRSSSMTAAGRGRAK